MALMGSPSTAGAASLVLAAAPEFMTSAWSGLVGSLSLILGAVGAGILLCGAYSTVVRLIGGQVAGARGAGATPEQDAPGQPLTYSLLLSLEFLIGAGVVRTLADTSWQHVAALGGLVAVRAVAGLTFRREAARALPRREQEVAARGPTPALEARNDLRLPSELPGMVPAEVGH
jgi:uncharacterized membrane protein